MRDRNPSGREGRVLKGKTLLALLLALALLLGGCGDRAPEPEEVVEETPAPTPSPSPTPLLIENTPEPTPIPVVKAANYQYETYIDRDLRVRLSIPTHWIREESGVSTAAWVEPVEDGDIAMRVAITVKSVPAGTNVTGKYAREEFNSYLWSIEKMFDEFSNGKISAQGIFMNRSCRSCYYKARLNGENIRGFVIMTYVSSNNALYALHYYAPKKKFEQIGRKIFSNIMYSVYPLYITEESQEAQ